MWLNLLSLGIKTGAKIYQNKQRTKQLMSDAQMLNAEKMAKGELEYKAKIIESNDQGWKDEFVLVLISTPIIVLVYSIFSDDPDLKTKIDFDLLLDVAHLKVSVKTLGLNWEEEFNNMMSVSNYIHVSDNDGFYDLNNQLTEQSNLMSMLKEMDTKNKR